MLLFSYLGGDGVVMADPLMTQSIPGRVSPWTINMTDSGSARIWFLAMVDEASLDDMTGCQSHLGVDEILGRHGGNNHWMAERARWQGPDIDVSFRDTRAGTTRQQDVLGPMSTCCQLVSTARGLQVDFPAMKASPYWDAFDLPWLACE